MKPWRSIQTFVEALAVLVTAGCGPAVAPQREAAASRASADRPVVLERGAAGDLAIREGRASGRLAAPTGRERFLLVLASTRFSAADDDYEYAVTPERGPPAAIRPAIGCSLRRERPRPDQPVEAKKSATAGAAPAKGASRTFELRSSRQGAVVKTPVSARAVAVGEASVVWADVSPEHPATLEPAFVSEFLSDFEQQILPRARQVFGRESDIDGDGRIALLFTPLTAAFGVAFFSGCDLTPGGGCAGSNRGEVLYLTPPNAIRPPYNTPRAIKEILAHELEHLIHHHQKVLQNGLDEDPDSAYLLEGFGALAQDVVGFQAGNLYVTKAGLDEIDDFSLGPVLTPGAGYDRRRDGALRGGAYLFVRWLYDRAGGDRASADGGIEDLGGPSLVRVLLSGRRPVVHELTARSGTSLAELAMDFYTTLAHDPRVMPNPCFTYLPTAKDPITGRQRGADLYASFHGMEMGGPAIHPPGAGDRRLLTGGVEYLALPAPKNGEVAFTLTVAPEAEPRARIVRIR